VRQRISTSNDAHVVTWRRRGCGVVPLPSFKRLSPFKHSAPSATKETLWPSHLYVHLGNLLKTRKNPKMTTKN